jgi:hypothetical protein
MSLQEWLDRLEELDSDNWNDIDQLRTGFSAELLLEDVEAEITFRTVAGTFEQVNIQLIDDHENVLVNLDYEILQLDLEILTEYLKEAAASTSPKSKKQS